MTEQSRVDFTQLAKNLLANEVGKDGVTLRSGQCAEDDVLALIGAWRAVANLPFGLWEEVSAVRVNDGSPRATAWPLLRARLFGPGGDLELWRTEEGFGWRFVGPAGAKLPADPAQAGADFWQQGGNAGARFFRSRATHLLWGERQADGVWREDRVAASVLRYPLEDGEQESERVQVRSELYSRGGLVEFVWHQGLEGYHG